MQRPHEDLRVQEATRRAEAGHRLHSTCKGRGCLLCRWTGFEEYPTCSRCSGRGRCNDCDGEGRLEWEEEHESWTLSRTRSQRCENCRGSGDCPLCEGEGLIT